MSPFVCSQTESSTSSTEVVDRISKEYLEYNCTGVLNSCTRILVFGAPLSSSCNATHV
jgi:hypothetical protein